MGIIFNKFNFIIISVFLFSAIAVNAYEDCVISTNGKLTNIKIQNNSIIDVFPLITVMNDKNTLIVHPLKVGETKFTVIKNNKDKYLFNVKVTKDSTTIDEVEGFDKFTIDCPPSDFEYSVDVDEPPIVNNNIVTKDENSDCINNLDEPPILKKEEIKLNN